jgi:purine-binding chemotaxis protein CheW
MQPNETGDVEFVTFHAGGQSFSLDIAHVREIRGWSNVTPLPHTPREVLGVMNLRGAVIPIYDLAICFGLPAITENPRNVVIIAMHNKQILGLLVEAVSEIVSVNKDQLQATPDVRSDLARHAITDLMPTEGGMSRVIDLAAVVQSRGRTAA